jgi:hypothetical protein
VRDQGRRQTCVAHAALACLEVGLKAKAAVLSTQYAHYKFMQFEGLAHEIDQGFKTTNAPRYLTGAAGRVCQDEHWPYTPMSEEIADLVAAGDYAPPPAAVADQTYGLAAYKLIPDDGLDGESIRNVRLLESLLATGYDIVVGAWVAWDGDDQGILRPVLVGGQPYYSAGHAMLVVGYDPQAGSSGLRTAPAPAGEPAATDASRTNSPNSISAMAGSLKRLPDKRQSSEAKRDSLVALMVLLSVSTVNAHAAKATA